MAKALNKLDLNDEPENICYCTFHSAYLIETHNYDTKTGINCVQTYEMPDEAYLTNLSPPSMYFFEHIDETKQNCDEIYSVYCHLYLESCQKCLQLKENAYEDEFLQESEKIWSDFNESLKILDAEELDIVNQLKKSKFQRDPNGET